MKKMSEFSGKKINLTMNSSVATLSLKFYDEQLPCGVDGLKKNIKAIDKKEIQVLAIVHDRDYKTDEIWAPPIEKRHFHVIVRPLRGKRMRVNSILGMLGVEYRHGIDDNLFREHGVETIRDFGGMAVYLTHDTEQSMLDGKTQYELSEIFSNLDFEEIKKLERAISA